MAEYGLVLAGGGAKGAYQAGVIEALHEFRYMDRLTAVSGASIGGLHAAMIAQGDWKLLRDVWACIDPNFMSSVVSFFVRVRHPKLRRPDSLPRPLESNLADEFGPLDLDDIIRRFVDPEKVRRSKITTYLAAFDEEKKKTVSIDLNKRANEYIIELLRATAAVPRVFPAVRVGDELLSDSAVRDDPDGRVPIRPLVAPGRVLFVVHLEPLAKWDPALFPGVHLIQFAPSRWLGDPTDFDRGMISQRYEWGKEDARLILQAIEHQACCRQIVTAARARFPAELGQQCCALRTTWSHYDQLRRQL